MSINTAGCFLLRAEKEEVGGNTPHLTLLKTLQHARVSSLGEDHLQRISALRACVHSLAKSKRALLLLEGEVAGRLTEHSPAQDSGVNSKAGVSARGSEAIRRRRNANSASWLASQSQSRDPESGCSPVCVWFLFFFSLRRGLCACLSGGGPHQEEQPARTCLPKDVGPLCGHDALKGNAAKATKVLHAARQQVRHDLLCASLCGPFHCKG